MGVDNDMGIWGTLSLERDVEAPSPTGVNRLCDGKLERVAV